MRELISESDGRINLYIDWSLGVGYYIEKFFMVEGVQENLSLIRSSVWKSGFWLLPSS